MVFRALADKVVGNHKKVIALWVALLVASVPLTLRLNDVLVYEETEAGGEEMRAESITAAEIVEREFPGVEANSSLIIVVRGELSTAASRDYLLELERAARASPRIKTLENFTSIYSIYRDVVTKSAVELPPALAALEANLTSISFMIQMAAQWGGINGSVALIWGLPAMFAQAWEGANQTAFMIYGAPGSFVEGYESVSRTASLLYGGPAAFLTSWLALEHLPDPAERSLEAYNESWASLNASAGDEAQRLLLEGYHSAFLEAWLETLDPSNSTAYLDNSTPPEARAQAAARAAALGYLGLAQPSNQTQEAMRAALDHFSITTFQNLSALSAFANSTVWPALQQQLEASGAPEAQLRLIEGYYAAFTGGWEASLRNASLEGAPAAARAESVVGSVAAPYLCASLARDPASLQLAMAALSWLNLSTWSSAEHLSALTNSTFALQLAEMGPALGLPPEMQEQLDLYYGLFYAAWVASLSNASLAGAAPAARAEAAVRSAAPGFIAQLSALNATAGSLASAACSGFNITSPGDEAGLSRALSAAALAGARASLEGYAAAANFSGEMLLAAGANLEAFAAVWNRTFDPVDPLFLPPSAPLENRTALALESAMERLFPSSGTGGGGEPYINVTALADPRSARGVAIDLFFMGLGGGISMERSFLERLYEELGPVPEPAVAAALASEVVNSSAPGDLPVRLPAELERRFVSPGNDTMLIFLTFGTRSSSALKSNIAELRSILSRGRAEAGLRTYVTGDQAIGLELEEQAFRDVEKIDPVTICIVLVLVGLFFLSLAASFFPFIGIGVALLASQSLLFVVGTLLAKIHYSTNILLFVLLMGTGMDYAIFFLARYREERREGRTKEQAIHTSITWAGESIATSGVAVMIGFGAMVLSDFAMLRTMGIVLGLGIGIGILAALTFVPSMLMVIGDRIFWPSGPARASGPGTGGGARARAGGRGNGNGGRGGEEGRGGRGEGGERGVPYFTRAVGFSLRHPWAVVGVCTLFFIPSLYLLFVMEPSFDFFEGLPRTEATEGLDAMAEGFGRGEIMPSQVVVQFRDPVYLGNGTYVVPRLDSIDNLSRALENVTVRADGGEEVRIIRSATPSTYYLGERVDHIDWRVFGEESRASALAAAFGRSNRTVLITLVFDREPMAKESLDAVPVIRERLAGLRASNPVLSGATILVGGSSAGMYDIRKIIDDSMSEMRVVVIIGIFVLLLVVLGSLLIPATAILSVGISIAWTIAATMAIFQFWGGTHVLWMVPLILFIVLMGLGMDYNIFLITRVREEVARGRTHEEAIQRSVERTGGIITICGLIMAGAFGSMMLSSLGLLRQFGFALFFAIILDAFVVRIYLMPAILKLAGRWSWYAPGRLQRVRIGPDGRGGEVRGRRGGGGGTGGGRAGEPPDAAPPPRP
ncbi:MAG: MMPL family transporter [Thermoplasmatota archaeon]